MMGRSGVDSTFVHIVSRTINAPDSDIGPTISMCSADFFPIRMYAESNDALIVKSDSALHIEIVDAKVQNNKNMCRQYFFIKKLPYTTFFKQTNK